MAKNRNTSKPWALHSTAQDFGSWKMISLCRLFLSASCAESCVTRKGEPSSAATCSMKTKTPPVNRTKCKEHHGQGQGVRELITAAVARCSWKTPETVVQPLILAENQYANIASGHHALRCSTSSQTWKALQSRSTSRSGTSVFPHCSTLQQEVHFSCTTIKTPNIFLNARIQSQPLNASQSNAVDPRSYADLSFL